MAAGVPATASTPVVASASATRGPALVPASPLAAAPMIARRAVTLSSSQGSAPTGSPAVRSVRVVQDVQKKTVTIEATYATVPAADDPQVVVAYLGTWSGRTCTVSSGLGVAVQGRSASALWIADSGEPRVTLARSGAVATATVTGDARLGSSPWNCAFALTGPADASRTYQSFSPEELDVTVVRTAKLSATISTQDIATRAGKYTKFKVTVKNSGNGTARNAKVTMTGKGLKFAKKTVSYGSIKAGDSKTKTFKVRMSGSKTRTAKATAMASGARRAAVKAKVLRIKKTTRPASLAGRYYWGFDTSMHTGWDNRGVKFVNKRWAYLGFPKKGTVACSSKVKNCKRYTYNARTGIVKIGKSKGKVNSKQLTLGKKSYYPLSTPKKGTRLKVALIHNNFDGCLANLYCHTWTEKLFLDTNGRFVRTKSSIASVGVPGVSQTWYQGVQPDERGRYKVLSKGRIQFTYANGKKVVRSIGIEQDVREKAAPQRQGLLIGDVNFYPQD